MSRASIAILGGGVAGVVLAKELIRSGRFDVEILERDGRLGGLQRSVEIDGFVYDIGSFVFDRQHELLKTFPVLYDSFVEVEHRSSSLTRSMTIDRYPMTLRGYLRDHGPLHCAWAGLDLLASKITHRRRDTLVAFANYYLGRTIYEESGLKSYIERFYCTSDTNVDLEFARQRLRGLPEEASLRKNFRKILRDARNPAHARQAWTCCVRSPRGFDEAYAIIEQELRALGVAIRFGCRIDRIRRSDGGSMLVETDTGARHYDHVISTIPVPVAARYMDIPVEGEFPTMNLVSLFYRLKGDPGFASSYLYNFTGGGRWKRITLFSDYYGRLDGDDYFVVECTVRGRGEEQIEEQRRAFEEHVRTTPVFRGTMNYQGGLLTLDAYPFYRRGDTERLASTKRRLEEAGLHLAGRQGRFDYLTSHQTAAASRDLAGAIVAGMPADGPQRTEGVEARSE